jgi:glycosyltransferase involved in cell wall biosynthesis
LFSRGGAPDQLEIGGLRAWLSAATFSAKLAAAVAYQRADCDASIAHWLAPCGIAAIASKGPLLCVAHGGDIHLLARTNATTAVIAALAARRAKLQFVSRTGLQQTLRSIKSNRLRGYVERESIICAMGVNTAHFSAIAKARSSAFAAVQHDYVNVLVVARLVPIKGVDTAIAALGHIAQPIRLTIAGDGPLREELTKQATAMTESCPHHCVEFLGAVSPHIRDQCLQRADVMLVPSRQLGNGRCEGSPQIAFEAMASGVPVLATRSGGLADLPAPAQVIDCDDAAEMADALRSMIRNPPVSTQLTSAVANQDWSAVATKMAVHWFGQ